MPHVPVLPESAPFSAEQRAYLNGFLAGLFSHSPISGSTAANPPAMKAVTPMSILFGSQTGNAEKLAKVVAKEAASHSFAPTIHDMASYPTSQLASEQHLVIVASTFGDGEPPDNAKAFWDFLKGDAAPKLPGLRFSICALGDSNYPKFCQFGKDLDARLEALGATRVHARQDCDVDYDEPFGKWIAGTLACLGGETKKGSTTVTQTSSEAPKASEYSKKNPFPARLVTNRKLNGPGSGKDVRHFEISLEGSGLLYEVGDALGVVPTNDPARVDEILKALGCDGEEAVTGKDGQPAPLRLALLSHFDISKIPMPLLTGIASRSNDPALLKLTSPDANGEAAKFLYGREIIDLLIAHPSVKFAASEFISMLRKLQPRLYSISSSHKAHPGQVHLTVSAVRYESLGRNRSGVCSTFLADRATPDTPVPVFVHSNKAFRPPAGDVPLIMVGPGTGIAPFRAFLEERKATGAKGKNWLFFGDQKSSTDYLYQEEIEAFQKDGLLARLDLAWSRDQSEKIYVQQRMLESASELWTVKTL